MSTMLKHISDNTKDTHDAMIKDFDSSEFPDDPRLTRELRKVTLNIDFDELDKWVVHKGDDQQWVDALKRREAFQSLVPSTPLLMRVLCGALRNDAPC